MPTWYVLNTLDTHHVMSETSPGSDATSSPNSGWTVGTTVSGNYSKADAGVERTAGTFATSPIEPDGSIDTSLGDCWRTQNPYVGTFATGNWEFYLACIAVSSSTSQAGNAGFRLFRGKAGNGSDATELTSARQEGGIITVATSQVVSSITTVNISTFTLDGEFLFVQIGWEITTAATMSTADVILRLGTTASRVVSPAFTLSLDDISPAYNSAMTSGGFVGRDFV